MNPDVTWGRNRSLSQTGIDGVDAVITRSNRQVHDLSQVDGAQREKNSLRCLINLNILGCRDKLQS